MRSGKSRQKEPFKLNLQVRVNLSNTRSPVPIHNISSQASLGIAPQPCDHDYDFYVGAWMGHDNPHMDFQMLQEDANGAGRARLSVPVMEGDTDMLKLGIFVRDPATCMMRHLASGFQGMDWIGEAINGVNTFGAAKSSLALKDNYSANKALLHFCNDGTDVEALRKLRLTPSILRKNDALNKEVENMTLGVHSLIENVSNVSNLNGGPNYVMSACFTESMGCAINYPLLNMTYSSKRHLTPLSTLTYMSLATLHYTALSAEEALALDDHDFVHQFVVPLCTSFTVCPTTAQYSGDKTLDLKGNLDQATEDFAMVLCDHYYKDVKDTYADRYRATLGEMSDGQLMAHIQTLGAEACPNSKGHFLISDDCETLSGLIKSIEGGIHLESHVLSDGDPVRLGKRMWESTRGLKNLAAVPMEDFNSTAKLLCRYGRLRENCYKGVMPCAQIGLSVVSAKGASFSTANCDLNGHACTVAQTLGVDGKASYSIGEGTTNVRTRNLPPSCPKKVSLLISDGLKIFDTGKALAIISENMGEMLSTTGKTKVLQTIPHSFEGRDPYTSCPFYMAGFFIGFEMGATIPGVIPLDTMHKDHGSKVILAENGAPDPSACDHHLSLQPMFGAPVAGLSLESVKALPINLGRVMGEASASQFLSGIDMRNREVYPPRASEARLNMLASRWGDLDPLRKKPSDGNWTLSCSESFQCADTLRAVCEYKKRIARDFNALQEKDPLSDGITMSVQMHMLSVVAHFSVPLPVREKWDLSCARNLRLALKALPFKAEVHMAAQFALL